MPAVSAKQEKFMRAVANSPEFSKKVGVPQSVGREFTKESKMNEGKMMKKEGRGMAKADMQKVAKKEVKGHEMKMHGKKMARGGGIESKGKTKGKMIKMAKGGKACK